MDNLQQQIVYIATSQNDAPWHYGATPSPVIAVSLGDSRCEDNVDNEANNDHEDEKPLQLVNRANTEGNGTELGVPPSSPGDDDAQIKAHRMGSSRGLRMRIMHSFLRCIPITVPAENAPN